MATIQGVYVALFGRPADPTGLAYFNSITNNGANLNAIANLSGTAEYQARFAGQNNLQIINSIYQSLFGRDADITGLNFFANQLATGRQTINTIAINILDGAVGSDLTTVNNKIAAANLYTAALDTGSEVVAYSGTAAADAGRTFLQGVTTTVPTAAQVDTAVAAMVSGAPANGSTFAFTTAIDNLIGTSNNDVFNGSIDTATAANNTFGVVDSINGGAGTDSLNILVTDVTATTAVPLANVTNVENFFIRNIDTATNGGVNTVTFDASTVSGEKQIWNDRSTAAVTITNAADGTVIGVKGNNSVTNSATAASYEATVKAGAVLFDGGTKGTGNVTLTGTALETVSISSTGGANSAGTVDVAAAKTINVAATTDLTLTAIATSTADSTLNVSGAGKATLGTLDTDIDIINASTNTGGVVITLDGETDTKFTGGTGADKVTLGAAALTTGNVDAGAGIDTLVANATNLNSAATGAKYTNFEVLQSTAGTVNLDNITGITAIELNGGNVSNLTSAQAAAVKVISSGTYDIGVKGAATPGQNDVVSLTVDDGATTTSLITLTSPTLTAVEELRIAAVDNVAVSSLTNAISLNKVVLTGAGEQSLTTGVVNLAANTVFDGSAATGKITIDASAAQAGATAVGFSISGGAAVDTITGTAKADVINGGAGNDILFGRAGGDTINGGDGDDTLQGDGVGVAAVVAVAEVQKFTVTAGSDADGGNIVIGGATIAIGNSQTVDQVGAAIAAAETAIKTASANVDTVAYDAATDTVTVTYKNTAGDVGNISTADAVAPNATGVTFGTVNETTKGVTAAAATIQNGGDAAGADVLTGGAGNDTFRFAAGTSDATNTDRITDLNLGTNAAGGAVDKLVFQNAGATVSIVTLASGDQANVTAATSLANAAGLVAGVAATDGATVQFTYGSDTYLFHNVDGNNSFDGGADILVKITGVTGTLDASDITLV